MQIRVYGISGAVEVGNSHTIVAEWTTGGELLDAKLQLMYLQVNSNDDMEWQIYMNEILVSELKTPILKVAQSLTILCTYC